MIPSFAAARFITFGWFDHPWRSSKLADQQLDRFFEMFSPED